MENSHKRFFSTYPLAGVAALFFAIYIGKMMFANQSQPYVAYYALFIATVFFIMALMFIIWELGVKLSIARRVCIVVLAFASITVLCYIGYINGFDMAEYLSGIIFPSHSQY